MARLFHDPAPSRLRHVELAFVTESESGDAVGSTVSAIALRAEPPEPEVASASAPSIEQLDVEPRQLLAIEADVIRTILEPLDHGEPAAAGYARREAAIIAVLETLVQTDAATLYDRLASPDASDPLATAFGRLSSERRARIVSYLGDAPRRQLLRKPKHNR